MEGGLHDGISNGKGKSHYALRVRENIGRREFEPKFNVAVSVNIKRKRGIERKSNPIIRGIDGYSLGKSDQEASHLAFSDCLIGSRSHDFPVDVSDIPLMVTCYHDRVP